ncbi:MAG: hypothetical protein A2Y20_02965 [Firmicutes bacterium GWF2_51_9]|nr:MAG: hypothetical protein A2Y20_02965 [Firmicutes bacterium GWF2_51_9]OGS59098.1 MAG: hypothetical protein A2Y19_04875 [Firmicutes bacterium GWE2_51_13]
MNKGYVLVEVLLSLLILMFSLQFVFSSLQYSTKRSMDYEKSPWNRLEKGCGYPCVIEEDLP